MRLKRYLCLQILWAGLAVGQTCTYGLTAPVSNYSGVGGSGSVGIMAPAGCPWTATSDSPWLTITSATSGSGTASIAFALAPNLTGASRSGLISVAGLGFAVTQSTWTASALSFVPVTPCRVVDTRLAPGPLGGPRMQGGATRTFTIPAGNCGIPANAAAYAVNLTVVPGGGLGFLTLFPTGQMRPTVSTLNSLDGRIKANAAIVPAGNGGAINVYVTDATDVVVDVTGYFVATGGLAFFPVPPCRVVDTRLAPGDLAGPALVGGQGRTFPLRSTCGLPASAQAYSVNITAVPHGPLGYLSAWASGQAQPLVSTLNALTGSVTANAALVPAGADGGITLFVTDPADVVIDVNGYFAPPGSGGLRFYAVPPCRAADTRLDPGELGGPQMAGDQVRAFPISGSTCQVPGTARVYSLNATVVPQTAVDYLSLWPAGQEQPLVSTLNSPDGSIVANAALAMAGSDAAVNARLTQTAHLILDINGYFAQ